MARARGGHDSNEEVLVPFKRPRAEVPLARSVRSTLIVGSLRALRTRGLEADYLSKLPSEHHVTMQALVAGVWVPMQLALAHYEACEALAIPGPEQVLIGNEVGDRIHGSFLGTMVRMASGAGATAWSGLAQCGRLWERTFEGGGVSVLRAGPKEAIAEMIGIPLARVPYFRSGLRGIFQRGVELFARRAYVVEVSKMTTPTSVGMRISWV